MTKSKRPVPKPFKSGRCQACHQGGALCSNCARFADQDYGSRKEGVVLFGELLERLAKEGEPASIQTHNEVPEQDSTATYKRHSRRLGRIFQVAGLSRQQRQIVKWHFLVGMTLAEISKKLSVSVGSVKKQHFLAVKKLEFRQPNPVLVREIFFEPSLTTEDTQASEHSADAHSSHSPNSQPSSAPLLRRSCPRCTAKVFRVDQDFQYCMDCLWTSDDEQLSILPIARLPFNSKKMAPL